MKRNTGRSVENNAHWRDPRPYLAAYRELRIVRDGRADADRNCVVIRALPMHLPARGRTRQPATDATVVGHGAVNRERKLQSDEGPVTDEAMEERWILVSGGLR